MFEAEAAAVAAGELQVIQEADALRLARDTPGRGVPLAVHQTGRWFSVFFVCLRCDGVWQNETVPIANGEVQLSGGAAGPLVMPSRGDVPRGAPKVLGKFELPAGSTHSYLAVEGVSDDETVRMRVDGTEVARAQVAPHGWFLLTALLPDEAGQKRAIEVTP